jgi:hypothetical protein
MTMVERGYPRLRPGWVYAEHEQGAMLLQTLRRLPPLVIRGEPARLMALLDCCTGKLDLPALCERSGHPPAWVRSVLAELARRDVLTIHPAAVTNPFGAHPRYVRQLEYLEDKLGSPRAAVESQQRLLDIHVTVIGLGGSAHWLLTALAATGIRRMRLLDPDTVELSNLSRQFLFGVDTVGQPKVEAAVAHLRRCDTNFDVEARRTGVWDLTDAENAVHGTGLAVVTVGHVPSRITDVTNRAAVRAGIPILLVGGATWGPFVVPGRTGCVACLERRAVAALSHRYAHARADHGHRTSGAGRGRRHREFRHRIRAAAIVGRRRAGGFHPTGARRAAPVRL